ncbi:Uncharacterized protein OS=Isosphaera pallida (strain ATCC 43644 / DSM 9630 / IS1B) GN=Isop_2452 PE=4 SV=1: Terminase_GpA [Gemmataceae bacterium]|nr:Uncharacterized protein OS=Isosphaera pallida (strain ATCC 43644 / DSM 9630 / IS1B) GN=Isop_2452 PE=4 SV=1: Terminase_GpA [Gemmataceae bacterium]VTT97954.1 Uncharacterized protein OS=Isosphaera pallida (strain ATCC 43644 / DSM 9630 / IS1B) GN=Isop_2452 PE=4 SV=1: Terminase_GpA [Gemmataceae bacterium]
MAAKIDAGKMLAELKERSAKRPTGAAKVAHRRETRAAAREVSDIPPVAPEWQVKRQRCRESLHEFCLTFLPAKFFLTFSEDHIRILGKLERIARHGGTLAIAMPRGSGKSEMVKAAALWSILYGLRRFVVVIGATAGDAVRVMDDLKSQLAHNDALNAAFPEATHCVRDIEGNIHRARFQAIGGRPSGLEWRNDAIRLAFVPGAACAGAVIRTAGLTGAIRGMSATSADGGTMRPDLVLLDDPQDRESATSPIQTDDRERIVRGDVLGLAGPTTSIAAVMPCTVITENDLADRFLNRELNPQWSGERTRLVESFPANEALWETYFKTRADDFRAGGDGRVATEFYREHRDEMDAGGAVAWPDRFDASRYASALEEAMVKRHDGPEAFAAEMQNEPIRLDAVRGEVRELHAVDLIARLNRVPRGTAPREATRLTMFIDVGGKVLWWGLVAWSERFSGGVVEYGAYPRQARPYFTSADAGPTLPDLFPGRTEAQLVYAGLRALTEDVLKREYPRDGGGPPLTVERCLIDCGWLPDTVHQFIRESAFKSILIPSKGYSTASNLRAMDDWQRKEGERVGPSWRLGPPPSGRGRQLIFDPDYWKSFLSDRLTTPPGGGGCLQFFGDQPHEHRLIADHLTAEYAVRVTARGRTFDKWELKPGGRENHLLDVLTGCAVAASVGGLAWTPDADGGVAPPPRPKKKRISIEELYAKANGLPWSPDA